MDDWLWKNVSLRKFRNHCLPFLPISGLIYHSVKGLIDCELRILWCTTKLLFYFIITAFVRTQLNFNKAGEVNDILVHRIET